MAKHKHKFVFSTTFFNWEHSTKGEVLRCNCGAEHFKTIVGVVVHNVFAKNGKEYYKISQIDSTLKNK